jgi:hypothetical protein
LKELSTLHGSGAWHFFFRIGKCFTIAVDDSMMRGRKAFSEERSCTEENVASFASLLELATENQNHLSRANSISSVAKNRPRTRRENAAARSRRQVHLEAKDEVLIANSKAKELRMTI